MACNLTTSFFQLSPLNLRKHTRTSTKFSPPLFTPLTTSSLKLRRFHVSALDEEDEDEEVVPLTSEERAERKEERKMTRRKWKMENGPVKELFAMMDKDGDGVAGFDDVKAFLELMGVEAGDKRVRNMIEAAGGESDGTVRYEALAELLS